MEFHETVTLAAARDGDKATVNDRIADMLGVERRVLLDACQMIVGAILSRCPRCDHPVGLEVEKYERLRVRALRLIPRVNDLLDALPPAQSSGSESGR